MNFLAALLLLSSLGLARSQEVTCSQDEQCSSGLCGREESLRDAKKICCESGRVYNGYSIGNVCNERAVGAACGGKNSICASGVCGVDDACLSEKIESGRLCDNDEQCSSGLCGREESLKDAEKICCGSGRVYNGYSIGNVCNERAVGAACGGKNSICASGVCGVNDACLAEKIASGSLCVNDEQCSSDLCGRKESLKDAEKICCGSGRVYNGYSIGNVCNERDVGAACGGKNSICASGVCGVDNVCLAEKIASGSPCDNDEQCSSGLCGREESLLDAKKICCDSGRVYNGYSIGNVCNERAVGAACGGKNSICASGVCGVDNVCLGEKIESGGSCDNDEQCSSGQCGREESLKDAGKICCDSGRVYNGYSIGNVCNQRAAGAACGGKNSICASGVCGVDNVCLAEKIESGGSCDNDEQCSSGLCGREESLQNAKKICCDSERVYNGYSIGNVCNERAVGAACGGKNSICALGVCGVDNVCLAEKIESGGSCDNDEQCSSGLCGREESLQDAKKICCGSGRVYNGYSIGNVCNERVVGAACGGKNSICASGVCGVDNVCLAEKIQNDLACRDDDHCLSGECARSEALESSEKVCCASGDSGYVGYRIGNVCSERVAGKACADEGSICVSGACGADGLCTKQLAGSPCDGSDDDCENNSCGRAEALQSADFACCPSGEKVDGGPDGLTVCVGIGGKGDACFADSICQSGICIRGACKDGKQEEENEPCEVDSHCASGACADKDPGGSGMCGPFSSLEARNQYFNNKARCPLGTLDNSDTNDKSTVVLEVFGDSSESAWTGSLANVITTPKRDQSATLNYIDGQDLLSGISGCYGGNSVVAQRQGDEVCISYQKNDHDGDGNVVVACLQKCIKIGSSGTFETYDKSDADVVGGAFGAPVQVFYFGETRKCRINVDYDATHSTATAGAAATQTVAAVAKVTPSSGTSSSSTGGGTSASKEVAKPTTAATSEETPSASEAITTSTISETSGSAEASGSAPSGDMSTTATISGTSASVDTSEVTSSTGASTTSSISGTPGGSTASAGVTTAATNDAPQDISDLLLNETCAITPSLAALSFLALAILANHYCFVF